MAESRVADELAPFVPAAHDPAMAVVFAAQRDDERRHCVFFDRIAKSVLRVPGDTTAARGERLRAFVPAPVLELFDRRLPEAAAALSAGRTGLIDGIALYHLILEGVVLSIGQRALLDDLADGALPAVRAGVERVERDERWHVGFGLRCLLDLDAEPRLMSALVTEGEAAAHAWGEAVATATTSRIAAQHRRRLAAIGQHPRRPAHATVGRAR